MWRHLLLLSTLALGGVSTAGTVTGYRGQSVQIRCPYKSGYESNTKYLCRGKCSTIAFKDIPVDSRSAKNKRFSLDDNTTAKVFIITITDLRPEDGGQYWCAITRTVRDQYTEILLQVKMDPPESSTVSLSTPTVTLLGTTLVMSTEIDTTSPSGKAAQSTEAQLHTDSSLHNYDPLIYPTVGLVIMVILPLVWVTVMCKHRRKNKVSKALAASVPLSTLRATNDEDNVIYTEVDHKNQNPAATLTINTIYSTAGEPADATIYATVA